MTLKKSVRQVTGTAIDDAVDWATINASWLFDSLSTAVTYALLYIEKTLKWIPWPVVVVGLGFLSFAVGRWALLAFTSAALLYVGFMGLWENTIGTIALMVVAVIISVSIGLPLGVLGRPQPDGGQGDAPGAGRYADYAQLCVSVAGNSVLRSREAGGDIRHHHLRNPTSNTVDKPGNSAGVP